jgi:hypothetical protein
MPHSREESRIRLDQAGVATDGKALANAFYISGNDFVMSAS